MVEAFLERFIERRTQASDRILIPFALSEKGVKLGRHLRDQRNWLRTAYYEKVDSQQAQRTFLHGMAIVADFLMACWPEGGAPPLTSSLLELDGRPQLPWGEHKDDADLCLRVLRDAGHEITVALLARFYGEAIDAADIDRAARTREFLEALRAVTAFFALWRGSRVGTENIDAAYRSLMLASFGRHKGQTISSATLKEELRQKLKEKNIVDRDSWVSKAAALPVYVQSVELTKLLLLAASHDAIPDGATPGLTKDGRTGICSMLSSKMWSLQVEHVAPQKRETAEDWPDEIYSGDLVHTLGNLTLLPGPENASVGNRNWKTKRWYYRILASEDAAIEKLVADAKAAGCAISVPSQETLEKARYTPHVRALASKAEGDGWTPEFVRARSKQIAERAWDGLAGWLGLPTHTSK